MLDFFLEHHLLIFESSWLVALMTLMIATVISMENETRPKHCAGCWCCF